jgi:hypothetical protein
VRVKVTDAEVAELCSIFGEVVDGRFMRCVVCNRSLKGGDFGLDHTFFCRKDDPERRVVQVRTIPRIWCVDCSKGRAKQMGKPYCSRKKQHSFLAKWKEVAANLEEQMALARAEMDAAEAATRSAEDEARATMTAFLARDDVVAAGRWISDALVGDGAEVLEFAKPKRDLVVTLVGVEVLGGEVATVSAGAAEGGEVAGAASPPPAPDAPLRCVALRLRWTATAASRDAVGGEVSVTGESIGQLRFDDVEGGFSWVAGGATRAEVTGGLETSHAGETRAEAVRAQERDAAAVMLAVDKKRELLTKFWTKKTLPKVVARLAEAGGVPALLAACGY